MQDNILAEMMSQHPEISSKSQAIPNDDKEIIQEIKETLFRDSTESNEQTNHENDLAIERLIANNPEMFGETKQDKSDPLDRFESSTVETGYDYGISTDLNLDLDLKSFDNLDLDIDFDAVLRGDPIVSKSLVPDPKSASESNAWPQSDLESAQTEKELSTIMETFQDD